MRFGWMRSVRAGRRYQVGDDHDLDIVFIDDAARIGRLDLHAVDAVVREDLEVAGDPGQQVGRRLLEPRRRERITSRS